MTRAPRLIGAHRSAVSSRRIAPAAWALVACSCFIATPSCGEGASTEITPIELAFEIAKSGEAAVADRVRRSPTAWRQLVTGVTSGTQAWISLGLVLLPFFQGDDRMELRIAFEEALITAPDTVLGSASIDSPILKVLCGPSAHPERDLAENSLLERQSAVGTMIGAEDSGAMQPALRARLDRCGDILSEAETEFFAAP